MGKEVDGAMTVFLSTLNQMAVLLILIFIGYIISRYNVIPDNGVRLLSKLENNVFIPALMLNTFMQNFTIHRISTAWQYLLCGLVVVVVTIPVAIVFARMCTKDSYVQRIYTYGLAFSNFGFMGNAVVAAVFPDIFMEYLIFVLPFWVFIYMWGVPSLLIPSKGAKTVKDKFLAFVNPMFTAILVGMAIGVSNLPVPSFFDSAVSSLSNCMSPVAMLLTGITIAQYDMKKIFKNLSVYFVSFIRLLVIPTVAIVLLAFIPLPYDLALCTVCSLAMPLGLNTIVIPSAYGQDTSVAAGMALISHLFSFLTIPIVFMLFERFV